MSDLADSSATRRLSLTKAQISTPVGQELLHICQDITSDGTLTKEEVVALHKWLTAHTNSDIPAVGFLREVMARAVADKQITPEERAELHAAIERVLPPEVRSHAIASRRALEQQAKEVLRQQRDASQAQERAARDVERERERRVDNYNFMVAGVKFEGRPEIIRQAVREGTTVYLARDPQNLYSRHAVEVRMRQGFVIGYVPEDDDEARDINALLQQGFRHEARVTRLLGSAVRPIPVVQANFYRADATIPSAILPDDVPARAQAPNPARVARAGSASGCSASLLAVLMVIAFFGFFGASVFGG